MNLLTDSRPIPTPLPASPLNVIGPLIEDRKAVDRVSTADTASHPLPYSAA
jgi:hypothetical protein